MPVLNCLACGVRITFLADSAGEDRRCVCGCRVTVPAADPEPEPAPPAPDPDLHFRCPVCEKRYRASGEQAGGRMRYKRCAAVLLVPGGAEHSPELTPQAAESEASPSFPPDWPNESADETPRPEPSVRADRTPPDSDGDDGLGLTLLRRRRERKRWLLIRWAVLGGVAALCLLLGVWSVSAVTRHRTARTPTKSENRDGREGKSPPKVDGSSRGQGPPQQLATADVADPGTDSGRFVTVFILSLASGFLALGVILVRHHKRCSWWAAMREVVLGAFDGMQGAVSALEGGARGAEGELYGEVPALRTGGATLRVDRILPPVCRWLLVRDPARAEEVAFDTPGRRPAVHPHLCNSPTR